ncbi:MAG TPA: tRNA (adenosine(37)-N6)-threonylcarbamoyltransferase complex ATPase subunit type 1 TsaE [Gemmatimonadaceae bacterium]|nr:tRNA (adenosine(37)-N6)-threonylcarbamoyltransferase complex ATPase subunit type 1 TsaE [Gemmatimonadaceae bacterium]
MLHDSIIPPLAGHGRLACTEAELIAWGERFGRAASAPLVVTITGDLGTGKTTLAQAICRGYGVTEEVTSPTYALVHRYASSRSTVYHLDLYRLKSPAELTNIGWDEVVGSPALVLIEWPERAAEQIPHVHVPISLQHLPEDPQRRLLYAGGHV